MAEITKKGTSHTKVLGFPTLVFSLGMVLLPLLDRRDPRVPPPRPKSPPAWIEWVEDEDAK